MKTRFVALAVATVMGLGSVSAFAQGHYRDGHGQAQWQHQRADQGRRDWGHNRYVAPRYYGPGYGYRRDDGDLAGALVLGALTGALIGQASNTYSYAPPPATYYAPPATYYTPAPPAYYQPGYGYGYYGN
jgi:hypothetical protein